MVLINNHRLNTICFESFNRMGFIPVVRVGISGLVYIVGGVAVIA